MKTGTGVVAFVDCSTSIDARPGAVSRSVYSTYGLPAASLPVAVATQVGAFGSGGGVDRDRHLGAAAAAGNVDGAEA